MSLGYEKVELLHLPTPLEFLPSVSADLGIRLYMKRDDLTPLAIGGNKLRTVSQFQCGGPSSQNPYPSLSWWAVTPPTN